MNIYDLKISRMSGGGSSSPSFQLMTKDNFYVGSMMWNERYKFWNVGCDKIGKEDKYKLIRRIQANIFKHKPDEYRDCGMPQDPSVVALDVDWWDENREKVLDELKKKT